MDEQADNDKEQMDILEKKDNVTQGSRGLQQWGPDAPGGLEGESGTGSSGTAARQSRVAEGQIREMQEEADARAARPERKGIPGAVNLERDEPFSDAARRRATPEPGAPERGAAVERGEPLSEARTVPEWTEEGRPSPASETTAGEGGLNLAGEPGMPPQGSQNLEERENLGGQSSEAHVGDTIEEGNLQRRREREARDRERRQEGTRR